MANGYVSGYNELEYRCWSLLVGLIVVIAACMAAWFFSPKNEDRTVWRSTLILSFISCYIMWAIVFLAQLHPLISPKRSDMRPGHAPN